MTSTTVLGYLRARAAEPSTRAGVSAFLVALGAGLATAGSPRSALVLIGAAAVTGLNAALTADPHLAAELRPIAGEAVTLLPIAAAVAERQAPQQATTIAAVAEGVEQAAAKIGAGA